MKTCKACGSNNLIPPKRNGSGNLVQRRICLPCARPARRAQDLWAKYRIRVEDYDRMVAQQGDRCGICRSEDFGRQDVRYWSVDHDHETGEVRGLLCRTCNVNLAILEDREWCSSATNYLNNISRSNTVAGETEPSLTAGS